MTFPTLGLTWWRDKAGYTIRADQPPDPKLGLLSADPAKLVGKSGQNVRYQITDRYSEHFLEFARVKHVDDLLRFFDSYGPLTQSGLNAGEQIRYALTWAESFRKLATLTGSSKGEIGSIDGILRLTRLKVGLKWERGRPQLRITPSTLLGFMSLQLGQKLTGGNPIRLCMSCGQLFKTGKGTGRRLDSKFCSPDHQRLHNSLKRSRAI